ncbi:MAG TPA: lysophospholipase, partial [Beijerinckiaceae bacterium]|nr:lysophospholipase [Beijerinckiaceae bacterium]
MELHWVTVWAGPAQGPYPVGNPLLQPDLSFAFPAPEQGAADQTFRLMVAPSLWGVRARIRLSNAFGPKPVTFSDAFIGVQRESASLVGGSNRRLTFNGARQVTVSPGDSIWSDGVDMDARWPSVSMLSRRLAVSFCVRGASGPMTWHAKALTTSYVSRPGSGPCGELEDEAAFPYATSSWFFLDALDMA